MTADGIPTDLPTPTGARLPLPNSRRAGWWSDPAKSDPMAVRYHDGTRRTEFVCLAGRTVVTPIERVPLPPDIADDEGAGFTNEAKVAQPAHVTSLIRYVAVAFIGLCFLTVSDFARRGQRRLRVDQPHRRAAASRPHRRIRNQGSVDVAHREAIPRKLGRPMDSGPCVGHRSSCSLAQTVGPGASRTLVEVMQMTRDLE